MLIHHSSPWCNNV